ncbi:hypothetical protein MTO96_010288 [Rhipicephalus appendiculatus]
MQVEVEGETIEEEEFSDAGWNFARGKSSQQRTGGRQPDEASRRYSGGAPSRRSRSTLKKHASSRMPDLPEDHRRIVTRPRDAGHCMPRSYDDPYDEKQGTARLQRQSWPRRRSLTTLREKTSSAPMLHRISSWLVHHWRSTRGPIGEKVYNVNAYCKGVIRNVDREITKQGLNTMIVHSGNPTAMQAKRIKDTGSVVIVIEGYEVPNHIKFGSVLLKCYVYRRQVDVCYTCAKRYQTPFIVRQRRRERIDESTRERQPPGRFEDFPPIEERETNGGARALPLARSRLAQGHNAAQGLFRRKQHGIRRLVA